jgi:hypothetical protein
MATTTWHGTPDGDRETVRSQAPPKPSDFRPTAGVNATVYARVHFSGNYGADLCSHFRAFDVDNITQQEAHQRAWEAYGMCGHTITYYDARGNVVMQE